MWIYLILLVLGFVVLESITARNHKEDKKPINLFIAFQHIFHRKGLSAEDSIALSGFSFIVVTIYLFAIANWAVSFGPAVTADPVNPRPSTLKELQTEKKEQKVEISQQETEISIIEKTHQIVPEITSKPEPNTTEIKDETPVSANAPEEIFIRTYEESEFAFLAAQPVREIYQEAEDLSLLLGTQLILDEAASGGKSVYAGVEAISDPGTIMVSDPTVLQPAGVYEAALTMKVSDTQVIGEILRFAVIDTYEKEILYERSFRAADFIQPGEFKTFRANYHRDHAGSVQFKFYFEDKVDLIIDRVEVSPVGTLDLVEESAFIYVDQEDPMASGKKSRVSKKHYNLPGRMAFGPYDKNIKAGKYRARFYLQSNLIGQEKDIALLDVSSDGEGFVAAYDILTGHNFVSASRFQAFDLDFEKKSDAGYLEFRIYSYGTADLKFDRVDLYRIES